MVKNPKKTSPTIIQEMEEELKKSFYCGSCNCGFSTIEEYKEHCNEEEHNYHITRRIDQLVPGLGFCPACSCLIQTSNGWEHHAVSNKHSKCIESLNAIAIDGDYTKPLGCTEEGKLGLPIESNEINQKLSSSYGYGHGGKLGRNVPLIGLNFVVEVSEPNSKEDPEYKCKTCDEMFTFEHRGKHLAGPEHRAKYLEMYHKQWHEDLQNLQTGFRTRRLFRLMWYAYKVEQLEIDQETEEAKKMRDKFINQITQKKTYNKWKSESDSQFRGGRGGLRGTHRGGPMIRGGPGRGGPPMMRARGRPPFPGGMPNRYDLPVSTMPRRGRGVPPRPFFPQFKDDFSGGYCGDMEQSSSLGKRPTSMMGSSHQKKYKEDPYAVAGKPNQLDMVDGQWDEFYDPYEERPEDYSEALEAIEVLENFAMSRAKDNIKHRINSMKNAVLEETGLSVDALRGFGQRGRGMRPKSFPSRSGRGGPCMDFLAGPRPANSVVCSRGQSSRGAAMRPPMRHMGPPRGAMPMRGMPRGRSMRPPIRF